MAEFPRNSGRNQDGADTRAGVRVFSMHRIDASGSERRMDSVAWEEPLSIHLSYWFKEARLNYSFAVTMRTPGQDRELACGLLWSEAVVSSATQIADLRMVGGEESNEILVELAPDVDFDGWRQARTGVVNSSCGVCGKRSREEVARNVPDFGADNLRISRAVMSGLPETLRRHQAGFARTGGLHAAALVSREGELTAVFEDIGRHNALDKLVGHAVLQNLLPLREHIVLMSSRSSFELTQKALMAGVPVLATVGGPSSLAVEIARDHGMTLIGFIRENRFNVYSGEWRLHS